MKKILSLVLAVLFVLPITACTKSKPSGNSSDEWEWVYSDITVDNGKKAEASSKDDSNSNDGDNDNGNNTESGSKINNNSAVISNVTTPEGDTLNVIKGDKPVEQGLNFKGKTFLFAGAGNSDPKTLRALKAFESKYNCKFTIVTPGTSDYIAKAAAQMSTGSSYDIGWIDGSQFPATVLANLWEPLEKSFTSADLYDPKKPNNGGIRADKSAQGFMWKGHLYGVCGKKYTGLKLLAYNKKRFSEEELTDPMKLYKEGKWTWDEMMKLGNEVFVKGKYYLGGIEFRSNWAQANGGVWVVNKNGKMVENFTDPKISNALQWTQKLVFGDSSILNPMQTSDETKRMNNFISGSNYMLMIGDYGYRAQLSPLVCESANFGKDAAERRNNLGMVPLPLGPDNSDKSYPAEFYSGVACGIGCDKRLAIAWTKFLSSYNDPVKDEYTFNDSEQKIIDDLLNGATNVNNYNFSNASDSISAIMSAIIVATTTGGKDVSQTLQEQRQKAQTVIDSCLQK